MLKMSKSDGQMKVMSLNESGGGLLDVKYFCKVEKREKLDVVVNLKANENLRTAHKVPQRYVILMDVSGSMNEQVKGDTRTLLERIKIFGNLFVDNLSSDTWVSIVTFSNKGDITFPMTEMNETGKENAKAAIESMNTIGMTNISDGLFASLDAIQNSGEERPTRDCIILFTDGQANVGITDANELVREYKKRVENMGRTNGIPVSAITIGDNQPFFLNELSTGLGSDSFYWLNETSDFEADMLLPMLLREIPNINDIKLEITCQNGVEFYDRASLQPTLQKKIGNDSRIHFIHMIPAGMERNIYLTLKLPNTAEENIDGKIILEVWKSFLDSCLREHRSTDYLELRLTSMKDALYEAYNFPKKDFNHSDYLTHCNVGPDGFKYLENTSSFKNERNKTSATWNDAQESMVNVMGQQCRLQAISALGESAKFVDIGRDDDAKESCQKALDKIEELEKITEVVLGKDNPHCKSMQETVKQNFQEKLKPIAEDIGDFKPGRLTAMASSFSTEMPTSSGVFGSESKQPFMPSVIDEKHGNVKEILKALKSRGTEVSQTPTPPASEEESIVQSPPIKRIVYVFKSSLSASEEEFDPDSLFLSSILPDLQQLDNRKKLELKLDILKLIHTALYS